MTYIVFSDVGGTVFRGTPWNMIRHHPKFNYTASQREIIKFLPMFLLSKMRIINETKMRQRWLGHMASSFKKLAYEEILEIYKDTIEGDLQEKLRRDVIAEFANHKQRGARIVLVSGIFVDFVQLVADHIGADDAIGTKIEYIDNRATGNIVGLPCVGQQKITYMTQYLEQNHPDIALKDCYGYADSYSDRALLRAVGHPIATYPDQKIRAMAEEQGWGILPE